MSRSPSALLEARGLSRAVQVGDQLRQLFAPADLSLRAGERIHLSGPSGAGKTSLLRALVALDPLTSGQLLLDGSPVGPVDGPRLRAAVCYVAQTPRVAAATVRDYLDEPASFTWQRARPQAAERERLFAVLDLSPELLDEPCSGLSGGERKRLAAGRALLYRPRALLLDEPTAGLDAERAEHLLAELAGFARAGGALVVASHELDPAQLQAAQRWHIEDGQLRVHAAGPASGDGGDPAAPPAGTGEPTP